MAGFTPGNLVVYRVGTGSGSLSSVGTPVFLDEYTPLGTLVQSIALPAVAHDRVVSALCGPSWVLRDGARSLRAILALCRGWSRAEHERRPFIARGLRAMNAGPCPPDLFHRRRSDIQAEIREARVCLVVRAPEGAGLLIAVAGLALASSARNRNAGFNAAGVRGRGGASRK